MQTQRQVTVRPVDVINKPVIVNMSQIIEGLEQYIQIIHEKFKAFLAKKPLGEKLWGAFGYKQEPSLLAEQYDSLFQPILKELKNALPNNIDEVRKSLLVLNTNPNYEKIITGIFDIYKKIIILRNELNETLNTHDKKNENISKQINDFHQLTRHVEEPLHIEQSALLPPVLKRSETFDRKFQAFERFSTSVATKKEVDDFTAGSEEIEAKEIEQPKCLLIRNIEEVANLQTEFSTAVNNFHVDEEKLKQHCKQDIRHQVEAKQKFFFDHVNEHKQAILQIDAYLRAEAERQHTQHEQLNQLELKLLSTPNIEQELTALQLVINQDIKHPDSSAIVQQLTAFVASVTQWTLPTHENLLRHERAIHSIHSFELEIKTNLSSLSNTLTTIASYVEKFSHLKENYGEWVLRLFDLANDEPNKFRQIVNPVLSELANQHVFTETAESCDLKNALVDMFRYIDDSICKPLKDESQQKSILTTYLMFLKLHEMNRQIASILAEHNITFTNKSGKFELEIKQTKITADAFTKKYHAISTRVGNQVLAEFKSEFEQVRSAILDELKLVSQISIQFDQRFKQSQLAHQKLQDKTLALQRGIAAQKERLERAALEVKVDTLDAISQPAVMSVTVAPITTPAAASQRKAILWGVLAIVTLLACWTSGGMLLNSEFGIALGLFFGGIIVASCCGRQSSRALDAASQPTSLLVNSDDDVETATQSTHYRLLQASPTSSKGKEPVVLVTLPTPKPAELKDSKQWNPRAVGRLQVVTKKAVQSRSQHQSTP